MGIQGLLPFLEKSSKRVNVKEYSGLTVAIDAYCWLHKGAFSCAEKLVMNEPTTLYVSYCMKFINMLLSHNVKPILVFDGRYLPAKSSTEKKRRESRQLNRRKGAELLRAGRVEEGRSFIRRSVDVSHEMALALMRDARRRHVDCIVAPYEADAQLAYLNIHNLAHVVITEDSDLLLFGCNKVLFKMDINGNGILIEKDRLHVSMGLRPDLFTMDKFRHMCILSGCDYLPSLPGIGLSKACKFVLRTSETDMHKALQKLPANLNMWTLVVSDEYRDGFVQADRTFRCQLVYDPVGRRQVPLTEQCGRDAVGEMLDEATALDLALGNIDPMSMERVDSFSPDTPAASRPRSIWSRNFVALVPKAVHPAQSVLRGSTAGRTVRTEVSLARKRPASSDSGCSEPSIEDLLGLYSEDCKRQRGDGDDSSLADTNSKPTTSPVLVMKNPFAVRRHPAGAGKLRRSSGALAKFILAEESESLCSSRYFSSQPDSASESVLDALDRETACSPQAQLSLPHAISVDEYSSSTQDDLRSSQEENSSYASNVCEQGDTPSKLRRFYETNHGGGGGKRAESGEQQATTETETSSFFGGGGLAQQQTVPKIKTKTVKKGVMRAGLSKPKQQTLLSMFKFQPRPKI